MFVYPDIDHVAVSLGPLTIHWYGVMYLIGFLGGWWLGRIRAARAGSTWTNVQVDDLLFYIMLGVILGGRVGSMLFYSFPVFIERPWIIFKIWEGGMSFHGGFLGVLLAMWLFGRKYKKHFFEITDFIAPLVPIGLGAGRIGNFINGELWGRPTDVSWAMIFPHVDALPRHPSQFYQAATEGLVLFLILWFYSAKPRPRMAVSSLFLISYGTFRFTTEFFREPDRNIGFIAFDWLTMGQLLSLPMLIAGLAMIILAYKYNRYEEPLIK